MIKLYNENSKCSKQKYYLYYIYQDNIYDRMDGDTTNNNNLLFEFKEQYPVEKMKEINYKFYYEKDII